VKTKTVKLYEESILRYDDNVIGSRNDRLWRERAEIQLSA
jgi:hypothetical protein